VHFEIEKRLMLRCGHNFYWAHSMPNKHNADRRHHIPKMSFKVQNWPEYEAGLRRRGSLTLWIEEDALDQWQSSGPEGQARYGEIAIQTCLMLRTAFKMALRQTEGLMASVLTLMNLAISAPDHTTVSRRAVGLMLPKLASSFKGPLHVLIDSTGLEVFGAGQWLEAKHGAKSRRTWRKLHLAVDADSGMIVAQVLTDQHTDDPSQVAPLLAQIDEEIGQVMADGAYDGAPTYETIAQYGDDIEVVIPPRKTAVLGTEPAVLDTEPSPSNQRDRHIDMIHTHGRLGWQKATGYGQRALVETTMGRYKSLIGPRLRARGFEAQQTEAAIGVVVLNRMLAAGRPNSVRRQQMPV
jgi:transposase